MKKALVHAMLSLSMLFIITGSDNPAWIQTNWPASNSFFDLYTSQDKVFARTWDSLNGGRMFLTADDGANWTQIGSAESDIDILSIVLLNSSILAGTWNGFYLSTDGGTTWNAFTPAGIPADTAIWSIVILDTIVFAGTTGYIYKSSDNGNTWTAVNSGIPVDACITSFIAFGEAIFTGSASNGVFKSTNGGTSWTAVNSGLTDTHISQLAAIGTKLFAVTLNGVFISDNNGLSWAADSSGLNNINSLIVVNGQLFSGTDNNGVFRSFDGGASWTSFSSGLPASTRVSSLAAGSDGIFAGTDSGVWRIPHEVSAPDFLIYRVGAWLFHDFTTGNNTSGVWTGMPESGCIPAYKDFDGDGNNEFSQLCGGAWHFYNDNGSYNKGIWVGDIAGQVPVPGDYNGDGTDEVVVFRGGAWLFYDFNTGANTSGVWTGAPVYSGTPVPAPMDYDGDGSLEFTVFSNGPWHFFNDNGSYNKGIWTGGVAGDMAVPGDYDGNGTDEIVVFRGGAWLFYDFASGLNTSGVWTGAPIWTGTPLPAPLDYDLDGSLDFTVFSNGPWHFYNENGSYNKGIWTGGVAGDIAISQRYLP